jgi:hypothetical protein
MAPKKSLLRQSIDAVLIDGRPHTVDELELTLYVWTVSRDQAVKVMHLEARRTGESEQRVGNQRYDDSGLVHAARSILFRDELDSMVKKGHAVQVAPAAYRLP